MTAIGPLPILRDTLTLFVYVDVKWPLLVLYQSYVTHWRSLFTLMSHFCHRAFIYS